MRLQRDLPQHGMQHLRRFFPRIEVLEDRLSPAVHTWNGAASDLWSEDQNWGDGSPAGDPVAELIFPAGGRLPPRNAFAGLAIQSMLFQASGYTVTGQPADLQAGVRTTYASGSVVLNIDFSLLAAQSFTVSVAGTTLGYGGVLGGGAAATV